ncbi:hypothetical protein ONE63_007779 [Megalurothrips usitatus]|uniref:rRNA methyltransferase 2, mitochondrial n=1 Tax=Megalurothrips usitatus TaxID=439358 RepID=A0AAV7XNS9_9NEOP|nr:hypothetical protein ONE63_007779 [Megalurothrips usitatus]
MVFLISNLRPFSTFGVLLKEVSNLKGRKQSSREWLIRQIKDPYVEKAKMESYRCRSAFKLLEIDDKYKFLKPGHIVVDCGASPGGWTQVASRRCNADAKDNEKRGMVIAIDLIKMHHIPGAIFLSPMDFTHLSTQKKLLSILDGKLVDVFMSDMAPNATGVGALDHDGIINLVLQSFRFALDVSNPGGHFLAKIWDGGQTPAVIKDMQRFYENVYTVKPPASRQHSAEMYLLCQGFRGLKR